MKKIIGTTLTVATLALAACAPAPAPEPVSDQNYGGKYSSSNSTVTRYSGCPEWAPKIYRGNLYCLDYKY